MRSSIRHVSESVQGTACSLGVSSLLPSAPTVLCCPALRCVSSKFVFDSVFPPNSTQETVFDTVARYSLSSQPL